MRKTPLCACPARRLTYIWQSRHGDLLQPTLATIRLVTRSLLQRRSGAGNDVIGSAEIGGSMKVRRTALRTTGGGRLTAVWCATLTAVVSVSVSACTNSSSSVPAIFSPSVSASATSSGFYSGTASVRPTPSGSHSARPTSTASPTPSASSTPRPASQPAHSPGASPSPYPTSAPSTGGGGTAGLQDGLLFGLGGAAILLGAASLAYRRRVIKSR
jgi:hypothetical protein